MSGPTNDLRERVWTVPKMPFLDPQKALNWVLGREAADWQLTALCPRCESANAILRTYVTPGRNIWLACTKCGVRSFYEAVLDLGATTFREFESITSNCGGQEIDQEWATKIIIFADFQRMCEERIKWTAEIDAGMTLSAVETEWLWSGMLGREVKMRNKVSVTLRLQYTVPGRLGAVIPYHDFARTRRMSELPALYFDNLGPVFNVDSKRPLWSQHLLVGTSWEHIYAGMEKLRGKINVGAITPLRISERPEMPLNLKPNPVSWLTTQNPETVTMLELVTCFPPDTRLSVISFNNDRRPSFSLSMLIGHKKAAQRARIMESLVAASNGTHAHPATREELRKVS